MPAWAIGHVVVDELVLADGTRLPPIVGGAGGYAAVAQGLAAPGEEIVLVSGIGADFPEDAFSVLERSGVSRTGMRVLDARTPRTQVRYLDDGERIETPLLGLDHFRSLDPRLSMVPRVTADAGIYVFAGPDDIWPDACARWRRDGGVVLWEIAADGAVPTNLDRIRELAATIDVLSINRAETTALTGETEPGPMADRLAELGAPMVVLRLGEAGALVISSGERLCARLPVPWVVDTTGAGNAFSGAFVTALARTADASVALRQGMAAAALTIAQYGPPHVDDALRARHTDLAASVDVATTQRMR